MDESTSQFSIRLPQDVRERLQAEANRNGRSLNNEILKRLEMTIDQEPVYFQQAGRANRMIREPDDDYAIQLKALSHKIDKLQNYLDSEKFGVRLFRQAFGFFSKK